MIIKKSGKEKREKRYRYLSELWPHLSWQGANGYWVNLEIEIQQACAWGHDDKHEKNPNQKWLKVVGSRDENLGR